jgi:hypothetical protein
MSKRLAWLLSGIVALWPTSAPAEDPKVGYLTVTSTPPARVFIDDVDTNATTPLEHHALPAGRHKLILVSADGKKRALGVVISAGQEKRVNVAL